MEPFDFQSTSRLIFGEGALGRLGPLARDLGFRRTRVTADQGLVRCGHFEAAPRELAAAGIRVFGFHDFGENPNTLMIESGRDLAAREGIDSLIGLGGGRSMDCAKGVNFLLTNGGAMEEYRGVGKAAKPMLPMIAVPTTAG